jgi:putative membrane protein
LAAIFGAALATFLIAPSFAVPAFASTASEQQQGAAILRSLDSGKTKCADLSNDDFDHVGEYVMFRMAGSTAAHEQMNQLMQRMMGNAGESQMHIVMGKRFAGCGGGAVPSSFGGMMGMMGAMSGFQGGSGSGRGGSMMGGSNYRSSGSDENDGWSPADTVMVALMVLTLLALTAVAVALLRRRPGGSSAREILAGRYAKGEIDKDEYQRRLDAMGGD